MLIRMAGALTMVMIMDVPIDWRADVLPLRRPNQ